MTRGRSGIRTPILSRRLEPCYRPRLRAFARWVLPLIYAGNAVGCPCCGGTFRKFLPRYVNDLLCPRCLSLRRHRSFWLFLQSRLDGTSGELAVLHFAPEEGIRNRLRARTATRYVTADADPRSIADMTFDITAIPLPDRSFDVVLCNHVFEHVTDDRAAMREILRVLRPGGFLYSIHPIYRDLDQTIEDETVTKPADRARLFGQSDHVRRYGIDFVDRLRDAGFEVDVEAFSPPADKVAFYRLREAQTIFVCRRPA